MADRPVRLPARVTLREWWDIRFKGEGRGHGSAIDLNQLSDEQLARTGAGEHPLAVLGPPAQPIAALPPGEEGGES